jgi:hypothetical protein
MDLLNPRKDAGFDRGDAVVLALYGGVLAWAIPHHVQWLDEAQAWLIARDSSLYDLLFRRLHYEGAPALWPLLLWMVARLHLPYAAINWLSGCFGFAGTYLLLRFSPFPRIVRWLLPFTFFLQYQYAVIARPYALFPFLMFALCAVYVLPRPKPILFALVAGLMVNVGLHGAVLSGMFSLLYLYDLYTLHRTPHPILSNRRVAAAIALFALLSTMAVAVAMPAPDVAFAGISERTQGKVHSALLKLMPQQEKLPGFAPPLDPPFPEQPAPTPGLGPIQSYVWRMAHTGPRIFRLMWNAQLVPAISIACFPIARSNLLAISFLAAFTLWLWSRRRLRLILPFVLGIRLCSRVHMDDHHTGLFLIALIAAAWIALAAPTVRRGPAWIESCFAALAIAVIVLQIQWTVYCLRAEASSPYDPGKATEKFLVQNYAGKRIDAFGIYAVSAQPYSPSNLFFNWSKTYWVYSRNTWLDQRRTEALHQHPDVVVVGSGDLGRETFINQWLPLRQPEPSGRPMVQFWQDQGYRVTHTFCGTPFYRLGADATICQFILEAGPPSASPL